MGFALLTVFNPEGINVYEHDTGQILDEDKLHVRNTLRLLSLGFLDTVQSLRKNTKEMYFYSYEEWNDIFLSAYILDSGKNLILIHTKTDSERVLTFFRDLHQLLAINALNPFQSLHEPIKSSNLRSKVESLFETLAP